MANDTQPDTQKKMTKQQFAAAIKQKVPQLAAYPDDMVVQRILQRRPDLAGRILPDEPEKPSLWQAATTPVGKDINRKVYQPMNQRIGDWVAMHAPPSVAGPAAEIARAPLDVIGGVAEAGRRTLSPVGVASLGAGSLLSQLRELPQVAPWIKNVTAAAETGAGAVFGLQGAQQALQPQKPDENWLDYTERVLSGMGQAILGTAPVGHAIGKRVGEGLENATAKAMAYEVKDEVSKARDTHVKNMEQLQLEGLQKQNDVKTWNEAATRQAEDEHQQKVHDVGEDNAQLQAEHALKVEQIKQETAKKNADAHQEWREKVSKAQRDFEKEISGYRFPGAGPTRETEARRATQAETKKMATQQRPHGPVYNRIAGMADKIAKNYVPTLDRAVRTAFDANWNAWRQAMGTTDAAGNFQEAEGDFASVQTAVEEAQNNILKGSQENIAIFKNILGEGEDPILGQASVFKTRGVSGDIKEMLRKGPPGRAGDEFLRRQYESLAAEVRAATGQGAKAGLTLPLDELRGYYTELGERMARGNISGDVYRAVKHVRDAIDAEVSRVAKERGQLGTYNKLKADWAGFMEDFYDRGGPLTRVKNATNKENALNIVTGDDSPRILSALGRYAKYFPTENGAPVDLTNLVGRMRSMLTTLNELPGTATRPVAPTRAELPSMPEAKEPKLPQPPKLKELPEFTEPNLKEIPNMPDIVPFDTPAAVRTEVDKLGKRIGTSGHVLMTYWLLRDIFHGKVPSPAMLAVPMVQRQISNYLRSPRFVDRVQTMVREQLEQ